jgi:hypothetical protein
LPERLADPIETLSRSGFGRTGWHRTSAAQGSQRHVWQDVAVLKADPLQIKIEFSCGRTDFSASWFEAQPS